MAGLQSNDVLYAGEPAYGQEVGTKTLDPNPSPLNPHPSRLNPKP